EEEAPAASARRDAVEHEAVVEAAARGKREDERRRARRVVREEAIAPALLLERTEHRAQMVLERLAVLRHVRHDVALGEHLDAFAPHRRQLGILGGPEPPLDVDVEPLAEAVLDDALSERARQHGEAVEEWQRRQVDRAVPADRPELRAEARRDAAARRAAGARSAPRHTSSPTARMSASAFECVTTPS